MAVSSVKELKKNRHFSWTRIKNQFLGIVGNPFNVIVFFTLIILFVAGLYLLIFKKADRKTEIPLAPFLLAGTVLAAIITGA